MTSNEARIQLYKRISETTRMIEIMEEVSDANSNLQNSIEIVEELSQQFLDYLDYLEFRIEYVEYRTHKYELSW